MSYRALTIFSGLTCGMGYIFSLLEAPTVLCWAARRGVGRVYPPTGPCTTRLEDEGENLTKAPTMRPPSGPHFRALGTGSATSK